MNPFDFVLNDFYNNTSTLQCVDAAAVTLLRVLAANYTSGFAGDNPYKYTILQIGQFGDSEFLRKLKKDWNRQIERV